MTAEEIQKKYNLCSCIEAYTARGLTAPDCPMHAFAIEEAMEEYATQQAIAFVQWLTDKNSPYAVLYGEDERFCSTGHEHTTEELYALYSNLKK